MIADPPPLAAPSGLSEKDADNLKLLAIFHRVFAGIAFFCCGGGIGVHYTIMRMALTHTQSKPGQEVPPELFLKFLPFFYAIPLLLIIVGVALNLLSAQYISQRRNRTFSFVVAGLNCLQVPFGVILGVFTIVMLCKESVAREYAAKTRR